MAILYPLCDTGVHLSQTLTILMDAMGIDRHQEFAYNSVQSPATSSNRDISVVLDKIKESGYRTIIMIMDVAQLDLPAIAKSANQKGFSNGGYLWFHFGDYDERSMSLDVDDDAKKFLQSALWISPASDESRNGSILESLEYNQ